MIDTPKRLRSRVLAPLAAASILLLSLTGCTDDAPVRDTSDRATEREDDRDRDRDRDREESPEPTEDAEPESSGDRDRSERPEPPAPPRDRERPEPEAPGAPQGGGDEPPIESYAEYERDGIADALAGFDGVYSDIEVNVLGPSTLEYIYTYSDMFDESLTESTFDESFDIFEETATSVLFPDMSLQGVRSPMEVTFTFQNPDGSEIWSETFSE